MTSESYFENESSVKELTPKNFDSAATWKLKDEKCTAVLFYAPWCPHCKAVKEDWIKFGKAATFLEVAAFNCEKYSNHLLKIKEDMPNLVKGFPTIIYYSKGQPKEGFSGERNYNNFLKKGMLVCQAHHK